MSVTSENLGHRNICILSALVVTFLVACGGGGGAGANGNSNNGNSNNANSNNGNSNNGNNGNSNNGNGNNGCTDQCPTAADTRCENGWVQRCEAGADGCLGWQPISDCASANERCDDSQQPAACVTDCSLSRPDAPTSPMPPDGATDVVPSIGTIHWADATGAARYAAYHGVACPPPSYPDAAFVEIVSSSLPGLSLTPEADYCWQVVSIGSDDCTAIGPVWSFTTVCDDPMLGPPFVTSTDQTLGPLTTSGTYTLSFNEPVNDVLSNLTWTPVLGSGTMGAPVQLTALSYAIPYSGVAAGDAYTLTVGVGVTDDCGHPLNNPVDITFTIEPATGETCSEAFDISSVAFPYQVIGDFTDDPAESSDCSSSTWNAVWFRYSPQVTGEYQIMTRNYAAGNSFSRLAVFQSSGCQPLGHQVDCIPATGKIVYELAYMEAGLDYMILFHTTSDNLPMVDPEISITPSTTHPAEYCPLAVDVTGLSMPVTLPGTFGNDPGISTSCVNAPRNAAWFTYTPPTTTLHNIDASNALNEDAYLVAFEGVGCPPAGPEALCVASDWEDVLHHEQVLTGGQPYTFMYVSGSEYNDIINPVFTVEPWTPFSGEACSAPRTIYAGSPTGWSAGTSIYTYEFDPGPSCEPNPFNEAWLQFTPSTTAWYNLHFTYGLGWDIRMAVFEGSSCTPYGQELTCIRQGDYRIRTKLQLTAGTTYLIMLMATLDTNTFGGPGWNVHETTAPLPGWDCNMVATTSSSNHTGSGSPDRWSWPADLFDNQSDHTFTCDADTGADVVVEYTTGPTQTTLNYTVYMSNQEPGGGITLEIADAPCDTGASLHCIISSNSPHSGQLFVVPNTTYYVWVGDREAGNSLPDISVHLW